jgi:hypothetical protein
LPSEKGKFLLGVVMFTYNPSSQEAQARGCKFENSRDYIARLFFKKKKDYQPGSQTPLIPVQAALDSLWTNRGSYMTTTACCQNTTLLPEGTGPAHNLHHILAITSPCKL